MSRKIPPFATRTLIASVLAIAGATVSANSPAIAQSAPSKEMREKMATLHEQMASCLRSDKSVTECRTDMMKSCQDVLGKDGCPMLGMGSGMHHHMMQAPPSGSGDQK